MCSVALDTNACYSDDSGRDGLLIDAGEPRVPAVAWFDRILADVGDSQNLQESLSTFSGHIKRVRAILGSGTRHSLVLLDEVSLTTGPWPQV